MKIKGNSSNSIQIGNVGSKNTINVVHNSPIRADHILLKLVENSIHEYDKKDLKRDSNIGLAKFFGGGLLGAIGFLSDSIGVSSHFGFSLVWLIPFGLIIGLIFAKRHIRSGKILGRLPKNKSEAKYIGNNEVVSETDNGKIITYQLTADCIYPNCTGKIVLTNTPIRELSFLGRNYVGICSLAGRDHSYRIDFIWNAYPENFDWRPIDVNCK